MNYTLGQVRLRKVSPSDADTLARWASSPRIPADLPGLSHESFRSPDTWRRISRSEAANHYFVIELADDDRSIGLTLLNKVDLVIGTCIGGTAIFEEDQRHKGYGFAAKLLQHKYAFEELGLNEIYSEVMANNEGVIRGLKRLGYVEVLSAKGEVSEPASNDQLIFKISRDAWAASAKNIP